MSKIKNINVGETVQFTAQRIMKGNPVKGVVTNLDNEWIEVRLSHYIEGIVSNWESGELKSFRIELINNLKTI